MKKRIAAIGALIIAVSVILLFTIEKKPDIEGVVLAVNPLSVSEDENAVAVKLDGSEYGFGSEIYIMITDKTKVVNRDNKSFPGDSLISGDKISVWLEKKASDQNVIKAKKVLFEYNTVKK